MTTKEQRRKEWSARIEDYRTSNLSMTAWCEAHHVTKEQLKYWLRKLKLVHSEVEDPISPNWVPLKVSDPAWQRASCNGPLPASFTQCRL
ncbi:IS66 family insertion sequence element accessory protein TnpB [Paenibacillus sp. TAF58]